MACSECGASNSDGAGKCWLCAATMRDVNPFASPVAEPPAFVSWNPRSFSLATLLAVLTLTAVCIGVTVQAPGIGIGLAVLSAPALVRTVGIGKRHKAKGQPLTIGAKLLAFLGSLAVVTTIAVASFIAFVVICFSIGLASHESNNEALFILGWILGIVVGGGIGLFIIRWLWWRK